jgi:hypothetical protein
MPTNVTVTASVQWTPPSAPANSGTATFNVVASVNAQNVGQVDVQVSDPPGAVFPMPFGSIATAKVICIKNMMSSEVGVRINGHVTNDFRVPAGGIVMYAAPVGPNSEPWASASIVTTASPAAIEAVQFFVFGD